jgi:hypothetical protein
VLTQVLSRSHLVVSQQGQDKWLISRYWSPLDSTPSQDASFLSYSSYSAKRKAHQSLFQSVCTVSSSVDRFFQGYLNLSSLCAQLYRSLLLHLRQKVLLEVSLVLAF